jgi:hypothetical protein
VPLYDTLATIFNRGGSLAGNPLHGCGEIFLSVDYRRIRAGLCRLLIRLAVSSVMLGWPTRRVVGLGIF